jgi:outer membrane lipoprotein SlyB
MNTPLNSIAADKPRLHPLLATAAVSVTVFSLAGIAAINGWLPTSQAESLPAPAAAKVEPTPAVEQKPVAPPAAPKAVVKKAAAPAAPVQVAQVAQAPAVAVPPPPACTSCGTIDNVREVSQPGEASGIGAVAGGVLGGILGNQIGGGTGKKIATVAGVAGGAYAGHQIEKSRNKTTRYEVDVRMQDGSVRTVAQDTAPAWRVGDKVRIDNGALAAN